jgi:1-phosphofructokinase family hexose kinase
MTILTVNANAAIDRILFIKEYQPGAIMYTDHCIDSVGGKGLDTAVVLQVLGAQHIALSFIAGDNGKHLARILDEHGINHDLVWVDGDTRIAHVIVETARRRDSHVTTRGYSIRDADEAEFIKRYLSHISGATWVIAAGSLPPGLSSDFYKTIVNIASRAGVKTIIDCPGKPMLSAIEAKPTVVKMNVSEFKDTFNIACDNIEKLADSASKLLKQLELSSLVITCGKEGILAVLPDCCYLADTPPQVPVNSAGAGDAVSAALAWRFSQSDSWEDALKWAAAASAAVVLTEGTAECALDDINRLYSLAKVRTFSV